MPLTNDSKVVGDEYDIIIVGGGSSGCVLAGRLSEAARQEGRCLSILLIESGRNNYNDPNVIRPGRYWANLLDPNSGYFDSMKAKLDYCGGREIAVDVPKILGGGGSVNFMMYTRASASDYDDWKMEGWYAEDLVPILRELENYQVTRDTNPDHSVHGFSGPFAVSQGPDFREQRDPNASELYHAAQKLGYPIGADMQNLRNGFGFSEWPKWIDPITGHRQDPAHRYIHPNVSEHINNGLTVLCEHKVVRVIIKEGRAMGVEIAHTTGATRPTEFDLPSQSADSKAADINTPSHAAIDSTLQVIRARSMVVLTAGTVNTSQLLERSGIGSSQILRKANVDCLVDLPGVGENLQDHISSGSYFYRFDKDTLMNYNDYLRDDPVAILQADEDFKQGSKGPHSMNFTGGAGKIRPSEEELQDMGPAFRRLWNEYYLNAPDKPLFIICFAERPINDPLWTFLTPEYSYKLLLAYTLYPVSRGSIHITSSSINTLPEFRPQYLFDPRDMPPHVLAYKQQRELARRMPSFRGEVRELHPHFSEASAARCVEYPTPAQCAEMANSKVLYTEEDNKVIEEWVKANFFVVWHWLGTAAMRPREQGGVVDGNLNVYGVQGLKVADLSICPENVGANTYSTALLVGGKAAEIITRELRLKTPDN
ncbi:GMC oxidoreductase-domain-containing protein [Tirmania nivea]|nr:GMC oxidoreductase-domain-containing protein [Tirmania nivea]